MAAELPIDVEALRNAPVAREPFPYLMVPNFVRPSAVAAINADFPQVTHPGSFPLPTLSYGPAFQNVHGRYPRTRIHQRGFR